MLNALRILCVNDVHSHVDEYDEHGLDCITDSNDCYAGIPRLVTMIKRFRTTNSLLLNAGDEFSGTPFFNIYKWTFTALYMKYVKYDAFVLGNHEFDLGIDELKDFASVLDKNKIPVLSSNIVGLNDDTHRYIRPYIIMERYEEDGRLVRIGVIGSTTPDTKYQSNSGQLEFLDPFETTAHYVNEIRESVDLVVLLSHNGLEVDCELAEIAGLDIIVGGHSHSLLSNLEQPDDADGPYPIRIDVNGPTYVVQSWKWGKYLGVLDVSFDENMKIASINGDTHLVSKDTKKDFRTQKLFTQMNQKLKKINSLVVGEVDREFDLKACKHGACDLGTLICDAFVWYYHQKYAAISGLPVISIINERGIRTDIRKGVVTKGDVINVLPFKNTVGYAIVNGKQLYDMVSHAITGFKGENRVPSVLQYSSNLLVHAKLLDCVHEDREHGELISISVLVDGTYRKINYNEDEKFVLLSSSYVFEGKDFIMDPIKHLPPKNKGELLHDALMEYLGTNPTHNYPKTLEWV